MTGGLIDAAIFDFDGVITNSTPLRGSAWKEMFDQYLKTWADQHKIPFCEFIHEEEYLTNLRPQNPNINGAREPTNDFRWQAIQKEHRLVQSPLELAELLVDRDGTVSATA